MKNERFRSNLVSDYIRIDEGHDVVVLEGVLTLVESK